MRVPCTTGAGKGISAEAYPGPSTDMLGLRENTRFPVTVRGEALFRQNTLCKRRRRRTHAFFFFYETPFKEI